jgi:hypothetical protein
MSPARWEHCIYHRGQHTEAFLREYLADETRRVLVIAGAGFDPRSTAVSEIIAGVAGARTVGFFLREERPRPAPPLVERADAHEGALLGLLPGSTVARLDVFASDNAVVGGRTAVRLINSLGLAGVSDVFVDLSALSVGVAFPIVRHVLGLVERRRLNLHLIVADEPGTDSGIVATSGDVADTVHGFKGGWGLDANSRAARLWMPQLARGKRGVLERIHQRVEPHAVCPILPFPASRPRLADELVEHFGEEFENTWKVDSGDIVYAGERGPLDLYRTILRMDDTRRRVFAEVGGSQIILSPVGSKALAVGALMAALDRDFTVMYVEALGYEVDLPRLDASRGVSAGNLVHVWLHGDAYPPAGSMEVPVP